MPWEKKRPKPSYVSAEAARSIATTAWISRKRPRPSKRSSHNSSESPHVVAVTSGTAALHTALSALRVGPGCEVIVPAYMWVSVIAAVVNLGAIPVLADIDDTFGLDPEDVQRKITPRTVGMIAVHMNGAPADIVRLAEVARKNNIFLLEDCAQCVGGSIDGKRVGTFGDMAIFSFQMNKNMSCGEAGAVVTRDESSHRRAIASHDAGYARNSSRQVADGRQRLARLGKRSSTRRIARCRSACATQKTSRHHSAHAPKQVQNHSRAPTRYPEISLRTSPRIPPAIPDASSSQSSPTPPPLTR